MESRGSSQPDPDPHALLPPPAPNPPPSKAGSDKPCKSSGFPQGQMGIWGLLGQSLLLLTQQGFNTLHVVPTYSVQQWRPSILSGVKAWRN